MGGLDGDFSCANRGIVDVWDLTLCNFSLGWFWWFRWAGQMVILVVLIMALLMKHFVKNFVENYIPITFVISV